MDSYPIILTSRVQSLGDLWGNFSERLMEGYYPAAFYRPLLNLTFAFDHAAWGLSPAGYQLSNVLWFAGCALALYAFLVSRPAPRPPAYAFAGVLVFLLHPLQFEVLPFPPRRPELMCSAFMLLALAAESCAGWRYRMLGGVATLLALASKETAIIIPALIFFRALFYGTGDGSGWLARRWLAAGRRVAWSLLPVALYMAARLAALGGLGGRGSLSLEKMLDAFPLNLGILLRTVTYPSSPESWKLAGVWLLLILPLLIYAIWLRGSRWAADLGFSAAWWVLLAAVYALSGRLSPWYVVIGIVPLAITVSAICEGYGSWLLPGARRRAASEEPMTAGERPSLGEGGKLRTVGAVLGLAGVALLVSLSQLRWSPVLRSYPLWQRATVADHQLLERLTHVLNQTEPGKVTRLLAERKKIKGKGSAAMFRGVVLQAHYSLEAWSVLRFPEREVRVLKNRRPLKTEPLKPSEVVVILDRVPKPKQPPAKKPGKAGGGGA